MIPSGLNCLMPLSVLRDLPVKGYLQYYPGEPGHCTVTVYGGVGQDLRDKIAVANEAAAEEGGIKKSTLTPIHHMHVIRASQETDGTAKEISWDLNPLQVEDLHMLGGDNTLFIHFHNHTEKEHSKLLLITCVTYYDSRLSQRLSDQPLPAPLSAFIKRVYLKAETFVVNKTDVFDNDITVDDCRKRLAMLPYHEAHELSEDIGQEKLTAFFTALKIGKRPSWSGVAATAITTMTGWKINDDIVIDYASADGEKKTKSLPAQ